MGVPLSSSLQAHASADAAGLLLFFKSFKSRKGERRARHRIKLNSSDDHYAASAQDRPAPHNAASFM
jgi:hypothetical protein